MSTSTHGGARRAILGGLAAAAVALPLTLTSAPAEAATRNGCTVTPLTPFVQVLPGGARRMAYPTRITCVSNRIVQVRDRHYEADAPAGLAGDDLLSTGSHLRTFAVAGTVTLTAFGPVRNTEAGNEEVYHRTSIRVASINGVSGWTAFQNSGVRIVAA